MKNGLPQYSPRRHMPALFGRTKPLTIPGSYWLGLVCILLYFSGNAQQTFSTFQAANLVIGQSNFSGNTGTCIQNSTYGPSYCAISSKGVLAIANQSSNRVLIWNSPFITSGQLPNIVVGKPSFTNCVGGTTSTITRNTDGVAFSPDGNKLIVSDAGNNRVLIWNTIPTTNGKAADVVIGQTSFTTATAGTTQTKLDYPTGIYVSPNGKLIVSDFGNHRVLIWNSIPTTNGQPADVVVGQPNFTTSTLGNAANKMNNPWGVWVSPEGKMLVADALNNRVLIFNTIPAINGVNADVVVGQSGFGVSTSGIAANRLFTPVGVTISPDGKMAIAEFSNNRVLIYNSIPTINGASADVVLGQPNFTTATAFYPSGIPTNQNMQRLYNVSFDLYGRLFVVGRDMHRGMIFGNLPTKIAELGISIQASSVSICAATPTTNVVTIINNGPDTATGIVSTTSLPASFSYTSNTATKGTYNPISGYWNIPNIPPGDSAVLTINGNSNTAGSFTAYANIIQSNQLDLNLDNNGASIVYAAATGLNCIFTDSVSTLSLCAGTPISVYYTKAGTFNSGNFFVAELSDGLGNFANPKSLDSVNSVSGGVINTSIPAAIPPGTNYRIRVRSTNPVVTSLTNTSNNITIFSTLPVAPQNNTAVCAGPNILKWNKYIGATGYRVYLNAGAGPATTLVATIANNTDTTYDAGNLSSGLYTWRVIPINSIAAATGCANWNFTRTTVLRDTLNLSGCNSVVYQGTTYTSSAIRRDTLRNGAGCDSLIRMANIAVTIVTPSTQTINLSSCNTPIVYQGVTYTSSTILRDTTRSYQGCDSVYKTVNISIANIPPLANPTSLIPIDNRADLNIPVNFSWSLVPNALLYDFYLWKFTDSEPATPAVANLTQINFVYTGSLLYGTMYKWKVVAKNANCQSVSAIQTFTTRFLPDLIVENIQPAATGFSGQPFTINWRVKNTGAGASLNQQWIDRVYISTDAILDVGTDISLGTVSNPAELAPGQSYQQTATFNLPQGINNNYFVFVVTNAYNQLRESNTANNTGISNTSTVIQLTPPPDLVVNSIVHPNFAFSGQPMNFTWQVTNTGTGSTIVPNWSDRVYLSQNADGNLAGAINFGTYSHVGTLNVGGSYSNSRTVTLPNAISGKYYLYVITDINNQVYEHALEGNNIKRSDSIMITLTPPVDLIAKDIIIPAQASNRQNISVSWKVENQGGSSTLTNNWADYIYISKLPVFNPDSATLLGSFQSVDTLDAGQEYSNQKTVSIPRNITGPYYIYVKADASNTIYENVFENNNISRSSGSLNVLSPDLVVTKITAPSSDSSGSTINIQWYLKNNGPGTLFNAGIKDRILLSANPVYNPIGNIELLQKSYNTGQLAVGDSALQQAAVQLPNGIAGNYYIYINTDYANAVFENDRENNNITRTVAPISIVLTPWPDLQGDNVLLVPDTATAGEVVPVSYHVTNRGQGATRQSVWTDKLYISRSPVFDSAAATFLRSFTHNGILLKDSGYQVNTSVLIPGSVAGGRYYIYLYCDADNNIYEYTDEGNNVKRGDSIYIKQYPPVDLALTDIITPDSASSGNPVNITWSVINNAQAVTLQTQWKDGLYLSSDTVLGGGDLLVKEVTHSGALAAGMSYTVNHNFIVPNGISGKFYALMVADNNNVNIDVNRSNNYKLTGANGDSAIMMITLTPPPDLAISSFTIPPAGPAGQPVKTRFTIINNGPGNINPGISWSEKIYLSTDQVLNPGTDPVIGSFTKTGPLNAGQAYTDSIDVFLPLSASGNYVIFIKTDAGNAVYEHTAEGNNTAFVPIIIEQQLLSDLIVSEITTPAQAIAGDSVTIGWKVKNTGLNPATGYMKNALYLSTDTVKSIDDALLVSMQTNINIAPQAEQSFGFIGELTGVTLNDYYVLVHTDVLNNIYEASDSNNIAASAEKMMVTVRELPINVVTAGNLKDNKELYYRIEIPDNLAGETLLITLKADSLHGNNEMYLRFGETPTRAVYDFSHSQPNAGNQEILVPALQRGTYYLMLYGNTTAGNAQSITLLAKILNFEIRSIHDTTGGNTGQVTIQVKGSKLGTVNAVRLRAGGRVIAASGILINDPATLFATFNLAGAQTGLYDVVAQNTAGDTAIYAQGFRIVAGNGGGLETYVLAPANTRPSNIISMTVEFINTGNTDLINPVLKMTSLGGAPIAFNPSGLDSNQTSLTLRLQELNGPVGILRPGAGGSIIVYCKTLTALSFMLLKE